MNRRIFTKYLVSGALEPLSSSSRDYLGVVSWLMEEDIEVIGLELCAEQLYAAIGNDGSFIIHGELSQVPKLGQDGCLGRVLLQNDWNSTPAFGNTKAETAVIMYPAGTSVLVKEEGLLFINVELTASGILDAALRAMVSCQIFYLKHGK